MHGYKSAHAQQMAARAGLAGQVDFQVGDAVTLIDHLPGGLDFVFVDLWKDLYEPCLRAFYPRLNPGAIVVADNMIRPGGEGVQAYARALRGLPGPWGGPGTLPQAIDLARQWRRLGLDLLNVSMGFSTPRAQVPWGTPAFLAPGAERVRREAGLPVASGWCIDDPHHAQQAIATQQMDLVMVGRAHLANPHHTYDMARALDPAHAAQLLPTPYAHWLARYQGPGKACAQ